MSKSGSIDGMAEVVSLRPKAINEFGLRRSMNLAVLRPTEYIPFIMVGSLIFKTRNPVTVFIIAKLIDLTTCFDWFNF